MPESAPENAPTIQTKRLWLTAFSTNDAEAVFAYASMPETSRYTTWKPHTRINDAEDFLRYALRERYCWAIRLDPAGPVVGAVECTSERPGESSLHYVLSPSLWGHGIVTEAAKAVLDWAFASSAETRRVTTTVVEEHQASRRVLEKCGLELTGHVSENWDKFTEPVRLAVYSVTREAWGGHSS
jgi:ribosomal-protein-alanine N-acetyltransferase